REELDLGIMRDRVGQVGKLAVERHGDRPLGERRRNPLGDVEAGGVWRKIPTRAVGKGHGDHCQKLQLLTRCLRTQVSVGQGYSRRIRPRNQAKTGPIAETRHNLTARSRGFKSWKAIAARVAQESSRQDHTAAPLPDDRGTYV